MTTAAIYLGGADQSHLKLVALDAAKVDSDGDPVIWDDEWNRKFHQWAATASSGGCIILLFSDRPGSVARNMAEVERIFQFALPEQKPAAGAYLVGKTITTNAWKIPKTDAPYQEACRELLQLGFGNNPCVVLWETDAKIVFLPNGVVGGDSKGFVLPAGSDKSPLEKAVLSDQLQHIADDVLAAEDIRPDFWQDASKFWPVKRAERTIQKSLLIALRSAFPAYRFESETGTAAGNIDIRILPKDSLQPGRAVIELKAIKQFGSSGCSKPAAGELQWLLGGITQALTYDAAASAKYLCAYDMRKDRDPAILAQTKTKCDEAAVEFLCYEIYASAAQVRNAMETRLSAAGKTVTSA